MAFNKQCHTNIILFSLKTGFTPNLPQNYYKDKENHDIFVNYSIIHSNQKFKDNMSKSNNSSGFLFYLFMF